MARNGFADGLRRLLGINQQRDDGFFDDLADVLIEGDIGPKTAFGITETLEKSGAKSSDAELRARLRETLDSYLPRYALQPEPGKVSVYLVLGVNGVGKTTSVAKMAAHYMRSCPVILAAADTFRAAAIEQLSFHAAKVGARIVAHKHGADPGAVVFDAAEAARASAGALVIADTAGRLHNRENLVRELQKIDRIAASKADPWQYRKILVIDATTGQNGLRQAEVFHEAVGVDAIVLSKYDSTARGGIAITAGKELGIPVAFVGTGEGYADFAPFDPGAYLDEFLGD